jgi:hypothetical protein
MDVVSLRLLKIRWLRVMVLAPLPCEWVVDPTVRRGRKTSV